MLRPLLLSYAALVIGLTPQAALAHGHHHRTHDHRIIMISRDHDDDRYGNRDDEQERGHSRGYKSERHHEDRDHNRTSIIVTERAPDRSVRFGSDDHSIIFNWFQLQPHTRTVVLDNLPPGIERQIRTRGHIPPGLRMHAMPHDLARRLGPVPAGYDRVIIGNDAVLINISSGAIADIIRNVL